MQLYNPKKNTFCMSTEYLLPYALTEPHLKLEIKYIVYASVWLAMGEL